MRQIKIFFRRILLKKITNNKFLIVKAVGYQIYSMMITFLLSFAITGDLHISTGVSLLDFFSKVLLYFFYDKGWNNLIKRFQ